MLRDVEREWLAWASDAACDLATRHRARRSPRQGCVVGETALRLLRGVAAENRGCDAGWPDADTYGEAAAHLAGAFHVAYYSEACSKQYHAWATRNLDAEMLLLRCADFDLARPSATLRAQHETRRLARSSGLHANEAADLAAFACLAWLRHWEPRSGASADAAEEWSCARLAIACAEFALVASQADRGEDAARVAQAVAELAAECRAGACPASWTLCLGEQREASWPAFAASCRSAGRPGPNPQLEVALPIVSRASPLAAYLRRRDASARRDYDGGFRPWMRDPPAGAWPMVGGRYDGGKLADRGGTSMVFLGRDHADGDRAAAFKIANTGLGSATVIREVAALVALNRASRDPSTCRWPARIVRLRDVAVWRWEKPAGRRAAVVLDAAAETLTALINRLGPLRDDDLRGVARDLLSSLALAHACGWTHRDVKTSNVLVYPDGFGGRVCRLADFSNARYDAESGAEVGAESSAEGEEAESGRGTDDELEEGPRKRSKEGAEDHAWSPWTKVEEEARTQSVCTVWYSAPEILTCCGPQTPGMDAWGAALCLIVAATCEQLCGDTRERQLALVRRALGGVPSVAGPGGTAPRPESDLLGYTLHQTGDLHFVAMLRAMLRFDPAQRMTCAEALETPYFAQARLKRLEEAARTPFPRFASRDEDGDAPLVDTAFD